MASGKDSVLVHNHLIESSSSEGVSSAVIQEKIQKKWTSYIWDTLDKSPQERRFLFKLDLAVLTFASLGIQPLTIHWAAARYNDNENPSFELIDTIGYFIKNLDQQNINNAFVSGMKEDLGLYGNQLNYMVMTWTVGYVIGEIPSNIILTRVRPSLWIPTIEVCIPDPTSHCSSW